MNHTFMFGTPGPIFISPLDEDHFYKSPGLITIDGRIVGFEPNSMLDRFRCDDYISESLFTLGHDWGKKDSAEILPIQIDWINERKKSNDHKPIKFSHEHSDENYHLPQCIAGGCCPCPLIPFRIQCYNKRVSKDWFFKLESDQWKAKEARESAMKEAEVSPNRHEMETAAEKTYQIAMESAMENATKSFDQSAARS